MHKAPTGLKPSIEPARVNVKDAEQTKLSDKFRLSLKTRGFDLPPPNTLQNITSLNSIMRQGVFQVFCEEICNYSAPAENDCPVLT
jgi:hypothetical protein